MIALFDVQIYAGHLVQMVSNRDEGCYTVNEIRDDLVIIDTHSGPVTDASFAPDGTALATASKDGTVKFFQVLKLIYLLYKDVTFDYNSIKFHLSFRRSILASTIKTTIHQDVCIHGSPTKGNRLID